MDQNTVQLAPDAIKIWGKKKYMAENKKGLNIVDDIEGQSN